MSSQRAAAAGPNPLWEAWRGGVAPDAHCGGCVWLTTEGGSSACHRHRGAGVDASWPACPAFLAPEALTCDDCGACCREAFHVVELDAEDPFVAARPDLVVTQEGRLTLPRLDTRGWCPCLTRPTEGYRCTEYPRRPRTCRDFTLGSQNCCEARRRVGLTP